MLHNRISVFVSGYRKSRSAAPLIDSMTLMMPVTFIYERNALSKYACTESVRELEIIVPGTFTAKHD